jgi:hypothetical protein
MGSYKCTSTTHGQITSDNGLDYSIEISGVSCTLSSLLRIRDISMPISLGKLM